MSGPTHRTAPTVVLSGHPAASGENGRGQSPAPTGLLRYAAPRPGKIRRPSASKLPVILAEVGLRSVGRVHFRTDSRWSLNPSPPPRRGGPACPPVGGDYKETYPGRHIGRPLQNLHQHPGQRAGEATALGKRWKPLQRASRMPALAQWPGGACHPSAALWVPAPFAQGSFWGWELRISASFSTRWNARRHRSFRPPSPVSA